MLVLVSSQMISLYGMLCVRSGEGRGAARVEGKVKLQLLV